MFTGVCLSTGRCLVPGGAWSGGCLLGGAWSGGCLVKTPRTATAAGGTHPTGMHCCLVIHLHKKLTAFLITRASSVHNKMWHFRPTITSLCGRWWEEASRNSHRHTSPQLLSYHRLAHGSKKRSQGSIQTTTKYLRRI